MATNDFPVDLFCRSVSRFLDAIEYNDNNLTPEQRLKGLQEVHQKTEAYFKQPLPRQTLRNINPRRIAFVTRTISHFVVYCWSKVPREAQVDISIYLSIINILDDEINADPSASMSSFWQDLFQGKIQKHPFWLLANAHLPQLLQHYGSFCSFNIMRCTIDYFEGCWIEQHNFQGYRGADRYPEFLRRLNCLGGAVGGTIFPKAEFDEQKSFNELSCVMAQIEQPVALMNDLFSCYKEFNQDEPNLISNWCTVDGISYEQALERLTDETIHVCGRILDIFKHKDPKVLATIKTFIHGYVTWHFCELRYKLHEVYEASGNGPPGLRFKQYYEQALQTGWIDLDQWSSAQKDVTVEDVRPGGSTMNCTPMLISSPIQVN